MAEGGAEGARWREILEEECHGEHGDAHDLPVDEEGDCGNSSSSDDGGSGEEDGDFADAPARCRRGSGRERAGWELADLQRGMRSALARRQLTGQQASGESVAAQLQLPRMGRTLRRALTYMWQAMEAFDSDESALAYAKNFIADYTLADKGGAGANDGKRLFTENEGLLLCSLCNDAVDGGFRISAPMMQSLMNKIVQAVDRDLPPSVTEAWKVTF